MYLKAGTDITGLVLILMISDQCTYTCLHHNTPFYAFISNILTFVRFPDFFYWRVASLNVTLCRKSHVTNLIIMWVRGGGLVVNRASVAPADCKRRR